MQPQLLELLVLDQLLVVERLDYQLSMPILFHSLIGSLLKWDKILLKEKFEKWKNSYPSNVHIVYQSIFEL